MKKHIQHIDFDEHIHKEWAPQLQHYTESFFNDLPNKKGYTTASPIQTNELTELLTIERVSSFKEILNFISNYLNNSGIQAASSNHCGYIPGGGLYENAIGAFLASIGNYYSGVAYAAPVAVKLENKLLQWVAQVVGYPKQAKGNITSGGSIANLTALSVAKKHQKITSKNIEKRTIYLGTHTHHSVLKSLNLTGLNEAIVREIDLNHALEIDVLQLEIQIEKDIVAGYIPSIIISSAGTTNAGAIDDLNTIQSLAKKYQAWHHVDAAYGGFFMLCNEGKNVLGGIEDSDSITLDPHKGLFQSYGSGIVLINNGDLLTQTFSSNPDYLRDTVADTFDQSPADLSIELSRPFRGLPLWISLKTHGIQKFEKALEEKLLLTQYAYETLNTMGFILGPKPKLTIILFQLNSNEETNRLIQDLHQLCDIFLSTTEIKNSLWIRIAILSHRTSIVEINKLMAFLKNWKDLQDGK